jgi:regulator of protease activity HflC (stomatin/prohibitin superfamily)
VAETSHARSRRAALGGLVLQVIGAVAAFGLGHTLHSSAMAMLALYVAGGIPIWFVVLLVFRQHELAALEAMDLEELRREKQASGGGEAIFDEGGSGGLGFMVAQGRLDWMRRWLVPVFGLLTAAYLIAVGIAGWVVLTGRDEVTWPALSHAEIGLVISALVMLFLFFFSRYASGMARVSEWQLLRGCGSYMLGNAVAAMAIIVVLGAYLYQGVVSWERVIAYAISVVMVLLGAETLINFLLDIYRPRTPGTEPRACFDSRLLGLIAEPGGIAHSLAEAINYQFGFEVSQTWFYQLLQRKIVQLVSVGVLAVWLLSCFVVVQPYEHAIIERFGRQIDPEDPLGPGLHFKWPAPIDICRKYNTDQLHEFYVGFRIGDQPKEEERPDPTRPVVELWTDAKHSGREHFDFVIAPPPVKEREQPPGVEPSTERRQDADKRAAQDLVRMQIVIQYKIEPSGLADFTQHTEDPHSILRNVAWNEITRFAASSHIDQLMGELRSSGPRVIRDRLFRRARELKLGLSLKYVGILQVHPERQVAEAFRGVVTAQQEKIAEIRKARVSENEILSRVAGDKRKATALSHAIAQVHANELRRSELDPRLPDQSGETESIPEEILDALRPQMATLLQARWRLDLDSEELERIKEDFKLGLGGSLRDQEVAQAAVQAGMETLRQAEEAWAAAVAPVRAELLETQEAETVEALLARAEARLALAFWNGQLEENLSGLEGEAAVVLAKAQARRWEQEMRAAGELALLQNERFAFAVAPEIYKARSYLRVLVDGIRDARKYFLAFEPGERKVHIRINAEEQARTDIVDMPTSLAE